MIGTSQPRPCLHVAILLAAAVLTGAGCASHDQPEPAQTARSYRNLGPDAQYVGIDVCAECHIDQANTYRKSQMGRSFKKASLPLSAAHWDNVRPIYDPKNDFYYFPFHRGDSLYVREFRLSGKDTVFSRTEKVDYIVGSGQHTNSHMMEVNGYLYQVPLTWYAQEGRWDLPPTFANHNWRFERAIEIDCMTCHNGMPRYFEGSDNRYEFLPQGINCERCHGPGSIHVREKKAGIVVNTKKEIDYSIVNPGKLARDLQFDICQRCHLQGVSVVRPGRSFQEFRPGMRLSDVIDVYFPRYTDSLSQFLMAAHPDRLKMSKCRVPSKETPGLMEPLPCIMCHNPHVPIESLDRKHYNDVCESCHNPPENVGCSESLERRAEKEDDCSSCHMPWTPSVDIPHVRITDHFIRIPEPEDRVRKGRSFVRLASLANPRPTNHQMGEGYLAYYEEYDTVDRFLDSAAVYLTKAQQEEPASKLSRALIRLWFLQGNYGQIAQFAEAGNLSAAQDAWTYYRVGEAYSKLDRHLQAADYYGKAVDVAPDHLWFRTKLAANRVAMGQPRAAIDIYDAVLADNPVFKDAYNNRGYAWLLLGDFDKAEADFRKTLALDPDAREALANLASLCLNTGRKNEALTLVDRLLKLEPDNQEYRSFRDAVVNATR